MKYIKTYENIVTDFFKKFKKKKKLPPEIIKLAETITNFLRHNLPIRKVMAGTIQVSSNQTVEDWITIFIDDGDSFSPSTRAIDIYYHNMEYIEAEKYVIIYFSKGNFGMRYELDFLKSIIKNRNQHNEEEAEKLLIDDIKNITNEITQENFEQYKNLMIQTNKYNL